MDQQVLPAYVSMPKADRPQAPCLPVRLTLLLFPVRVHGRRLSVPRALVPPSIIQELPEHTRTLSRPSRYHESWHGAVNSAHGPAPSLTNVFLLAFSYLGLLRVRCTARSAFCVSSPSHWISAVLSSPSLPLTPASSGRCAAAHVHASAAGEHGVVVGGGLWL